VEPVILTRGWMFELGRITMGMGNISPPETVMYIFTNDFQ
jgi:hypothetical protein